MLSELSFDEWVAETRREMMEFEGARFAVALTEMLINHDGAYSFELVRHGVVAFGLEPVEQALEDGKTGSMLKNRTFSAIHNVIAKFCLAEAPEADMTGQSNNNERIYNLFRECICKWLTSKPLNAVKSKKPGHALLLALSQQWENLKVYAKYMYRVFLPLSARNGYIDRARKLHIVAACLGLFNLIVYRGHRTGIVASVQELIQSDRRGEEVDLGLLRSSIELILVMGQCAHMVNQEMDHVSVEYSPRIRA